MCKEEVKHKNKKSKSSVLWNYSCSCFCLVLQQWNTKKTEIWGGLANWVDRNENRKHQLDQIPVYKGQTTISPPISLPRPEERIDPADVTTAQLLYGPRSEVSCFEGNWEAQGSEENGWKSEVKVETSTWIFSWQRSFGPLSLGLLDTPPGPETLTPYLFIAWQEEFKRQNWKCFRVLDHKIIKNLQL